MPSYEFQAVDGRTHVADFDHEVSQDELNSHIAFVNQSLTDRQSAAQAQSAADAGAGTAASYLGLAGRGLESGLASAVRGFGSMADSPTLVGLGNRADAATQAALPVRPDVAQSTTGRIVGGTASMAGLAAPALIPGVGEAALLGTVLGSTYDQGEQAALASGADPVTARQQADLNSIIQTPIQMTAGRVARGLLAGPIEGVTHPLGQLAIGAGEAGGIMGLSQAGTNYVEGKPLDENVGEAALLGGASAGLLGLPRTGFALLRPTAPAAPVVASDMTGERVADSPEDRQVADGVVNVGPAAPPDPTGVLRAEALKDQLRTGWMRATGGQPGDSDSPLTQWYRAQEQAAQQAAATPQISPPDLSGTSPALPSLTVSDALLAGAKVEWQGQRGRLTRGEGNQLLLNTPQGTYEIGNNVAGDSPLDAAGVSLLKPNAAKQAVISALQSLAAQPDGGDAAHAALEQEAQATEPKWLGDAANHPALNEIADLLNLGQSEVVGQGAAATATPEYQAMLRSYPEAKLKQAENIVVNTLDRIEKTPHADWVKNSWAEPFYDLWHGIQSIRETQGTHEQSSPSSAQEEAPQGIPPVSSDARRGGRDLQQSAPATPDALPASAASPVTAGPDPVTSKALAVADEVEATSPLTAAALRLKAGATEPPPPIPDASTPETPAPPAVADVAPVASSDAPPVAEPTEAEAPPQPPEGAAPVVEPPTQVVASDPAQAMLDAEAAAAKPRRVTSDNVTMPQFKPDYFKGSKPAKGEEAAVRAANDYFERQRTSLESELSGYAAFDPGQIIDAAKLKYLKNFRQGKAGEAESAFPQILNNLKADFVRKAESRKGLRGESLDADSETAASRADTTADPDQLTPREIAGQKERQARIEEIKGEFRATLKPADAVQLDNALDYFIRTGNRPAPDTRAGQLLERYGHFLNDELNDAPTKAAVGDSGHGLPDDAGDPAVSLRGPDAPARKGTAAGDRGASAGSSPGRRDAGAAEDAAGRSQGVPAAPARRADSGAAPGLTSYAESLLARLAPGTQTKIKVIEQGEFRRLEGEHQRNMEGTPEAAILRNTIYLSAEALLRHDGGPLNVINVLHEFAHNFEQLLTKPQRAALEAQRRQELQSGRSPLHVQGELRPEVARGVESDFGEWFAERLAWENLQWAEGKLRDPSGPLGLIANRLRGLVARVWAAITGRPQEAAAQFRQWLQDGAKAQEADTQFARRLREPKQESLKTDDTELNGRWMSDEQLRAEFPTSEDSAASETGVLSQVAGLRAGSDGFWSVIPPDHEENGHDAMAITTGPFATQADAQNFNDSEVGSPAVRIVEVRNGQPLSNPFAPPKNVTPTQARFARRNSKPAPVDLTDERDSKQGAQTDETQSRNGPTEDRAGTATEQRGSPQFQAQELSGSTGGLASSRPYDAAARRTVAEQSARLVADAERAGRLYPADYLDRTAGPVLRSGQEHMVRLPADGQRVIKTAPPDKGGYGLVPYAKAEGVIDLRPATPAEYFERLALQNQIFGDDIRYEGMARTQRGGSEIVTSQDYVTGSRPTEQEIDRYMAGLGFEPVAGHEGNAYYRASDNTFVTDAAPRNFKKNAKGVAAIDVVAVHPDDRLLSVLEEGMGGSTGEARFARRNVAEQPAAEAGARSASEAEEARELWEQKGTDSPFFKRWFGKSAVVDARGKPLVVFHGTPETKYVPARYANGDASAREELASLAQKHGIVSGGDVASVFERWQSMGMAAERGVTPEDIAHARQLTEASRARTLSESRRKLAFSAFRMPEGELELGSHFGTQEQAENMGEPFGFFLNLKNPLRLADLGTWNYQSVMREARKAGVKINDAEYDRVFNAVDNNAALRQLLESKGVDGIVYRNEAEGDGDSYIAFRPNQIKSATDNAGTFDPANPDIRFARRNAPVRTRTIDPARPIRDQAKEAIDAANPSRGGIVSRAIAGSLDNGWLARAREGGEALKSIKDLLAPASASPEARQTADLLRARLGEKARELEQGYHALGDGFKAFDRLRVDTAEGQKASLDFQDRIERGLPQADPRLQPFADEMRAQLDQVKGELQARGKLASTVQDYFPHMWTKPEQASQVFAEIYSKHPLQGSEAYTKQRTIDYIQEGVAAGLIPVTWNPAELAMLKINEMRKSLMASHVVEDLQTEGLAQPLAPGVDPPSGRVAINVGGERLSMAPEAARIIQNYLSPGLGGKAAYKSARYFGNALNQAQLGLSAFHAGFVAMDTTTSKASLGLEQIVNGFQRGNYGKVAEGFFNIGKASIPLYAPIEAVLRGSKILDEYKEAGAIGGWTTDAVNALQLGGGRVSMDAFYKSGALDNFKKAWRQGNVPGAILRAPLAFIDAVSHPLMSWIVPRVKLAVFADLAREELDRLGPGASLQTRRAAMRSVWDSVDNRLGQVVYDNLFWNKVLKDGAMLGVRSVGWNLGTIRELAGGALDSATLIQRLQAGDAALTHRMAYAFALPVVTGITGSLLYYLHNGKPPEDWKDALMPRTGRKNADGSDERIQLPTYLKDIQSYAKHPAQTLVNKINPLGSALSEMYNNRDFYGAEIHNTNDPLMQQMLQELKFIARVPVPFSITGASRRQGPGLLSGTREGVGNFLENTFGVTPAPAAMSRTPAENALAEAIQRRQPAAGRTPEEQERALLRKSMMSDLRNGGDVRAELAQAVRDKKMTPMQASKFLSDSRIDPKLRMYRSLSVDDARRVYELGSPQEKAMFLPLLRQKLARAGQPMVQPALR